MAITDKRKRHKLMERAIRSLMGANLPPRFKFKDTYASIEVPTAYEQHLPTQQEIEDKFDELETQEEAVEAVASEATVISKFDSVITSNLEVGTSNLFVDTETGRVGIGTTNPQVELDVSGIVNISSNLEVGTSNLFVNTETGRVGVGTGSPQEKLDVRGAIVAPVVSYSHSQDAPYLIAAGTTYDGTSTNWATEGIQHRIKTSSGGVPRVTIDTPQSGEVFCVTNSGNVGIGTTNPGRPLEIYTGNGAIPGLRLRRYPTGATYTDLQHADPSSPANSAEGLAITVGDGNATTREVMRVCGDGNVTKPYQSACRVSFNNTNWTLGSGSTNIIVYNYELYDINNDYNTSTGKFTCPYDGRYLAFHVLTGRNTRYTASIVEAKIFHNTAEVNRQFIGYGEGNYNATASCIISASKNDTINAGMWNGHSSNNFNGNNEGGGSQFIVYFLG